MPNTAAALPEISPDGLDVDDTDQAGHLLRRRSGVQGQEARARRRGLRLFAGSASSTRRCARRICRCSTAASSARTRSSPGRRRRGKFDYDAPIEGLQALDRYTLRVKLTHPAYSLLSDLTTTPTAAVAREVIDAYGDAQHVGDGESGRHGSLPAQGMASRPEDRARSQSRLSRRVLIPESSRSGGPRRSWRRLKGKRLPLIGRDRDQHHRGSNPRLLAFEQGDLDYLAGAGGPRGQRARRGQRAEAALRESRASRSRAASSRRSPTPISTWRTRSSAATRTDRIALRRAIGMAYNVRGGDPRPPAGPGGMPATQLIPPGVTGYDPKFEGHVDATTSPAPRRCSTSSATSIATATAGATSRTASRS